MLVFWSQASLLVSGKSSVRFARGLAPLRCARQRALGQKPWPTMSWGAETMSHDVAHDMNPDLDSGMSLLEPGSDATNLDR